MRLVTQRFKAEADDDGVVRAGRRGDCVAACLASIFELPIETFPEADQWQWLSRWLSVYYPGIQTLRRDYNEKRDRASNAGYWIASILSDRFKVECVRCGDNESYPPHWYNRSECPWCDATGIARGWHSVVMKNAERVWDPHPDVDWDAPLTFVAETVFICSDVSRLAARVLPAAFGTVEV